MVITLCKDIKTLQVGSTAMTKGAGKVTRMNGRYSITVKLSKDIITYQKHMGGFYRGYQHRLMGSGFENLAHF